MQVPVYGNVISIKRLKELLNELDDDLYLIPNDYKHLSILKLTYFENGNLKDVLSDSTIHLYSEEIISNKTFEAWKRSEREDKWFLNKVKKYWNVGVDEFRRKFLGTNPSKNRKKDCIKMNERGRSLAHIEKISKVEKHFNADSLDIVDVLGWRCVTKLGEFKEGELCVYVECDSILPEKAEFEFLRSKKFRIKTQRIRQFISQGICFPLSILPPGNYEEGQDVTQEIGAIHYDPESPLNFKKEYKPQSKFIKFCLKYWIGRKLILPFIRKPKGAWPGDWLAKTDEERIQNIPRILETHKDKTFYVTEKIDYQSVTFFLRKMKVGPFNKLVFGVCSRNLWLKTEDNSLYWEIARKYNIEKILREEYRRSGKTLTVQGEQGSKLVQKNKYGINEPRFWIFNIIDNQTGIHFNLNEMEKFRYDYNKLSGQELELVPVLDTEFKLKSTVAEMVEYSKGKSMINNKIEREGIVVRNIEGGDKISFKVINPNFLLKWDE